MVAKKQQRKTSIRLTDRYMAVLGHIGQYSITVTEAIEQLPEFAEAGITAADGVRRRLLQGDYIGRQDLGSDQYRNAYFLTRKGRDVLNEDHFRFGPLADDPRIRAFAVLAFCCLQSPRRELLSRADFRDAFPALWQPQRRAHYYIDTEGDKPRLAYIRVDFGRSETIPTDRLLAYCRRDVSNLLALPRAIDMVAQDAIQITLLTAMEQKVQVIHRLLARLAREGDDLPIPIRVHHLPQLRELVAPICR